MCIKGNQVQINQACIHMPSNEKFIDYFVEFLDKIMIEK